MTANIIELPSRLKAPRLIPTGTGLPCQQEDPDLWFSSLPAELDLAKAYCQGCRNREPCLTSALERSEPTGVWGGEIFEQGRIIERKRPRGRPRKDDSRARSEMMHPATAGRLAGGRQTVQSSGTAAVVPVPSLIDRFTR